MRDIANFKTKWDYKLRHSLKDLSPQRAKISSDSVAVIQKNIDGFKKLPQEMKLDFILSLKNLAGLKITHQDAHEATAIKRCEEYCLNQIRFCSETVKLMPQENSTSVKTKQKAAAKSIQQNNFTPVEAQRRVLNIKR